MTELLKLLRDAVGIRPLIPVVLILLAALLFKAVREYPVRELLHDRWFLLVSLLFVSGAVAYEIVTSGLADRTHQGRIGVYVARLKQDPAGKLHLRLLEGIRANLDLKSQDLPFRMEIRDLKREIGNGEEAEVETLAPRLNAAIVLWGTAIDEKSFYPRLWIRSAGSVKSATPLNVTDLPALADYSATIWDRLPAAIATDSQSDSPATLRQDVEKLRLELADLRTLIAAGSVSRPGPSAAPSGRVAALLVGIGDYDKITDLLGPPNDVMVLRRLLEQRGAFVTVLLDKSVTKPALEQAVDKVAASLQPDDALFIYLSGHTGKDNEGKSNFYLPTLDPLPLAPFFRSILARHRATIIAVDGGFDVKEVPPIELQQGAVLSADPSGRGLATERSVDGVHMGAFTWALARALETAPLGIGVSIRDLFSAASATLNREGIQPEPMIVFGQDVPTI